jgi:hypothetical protein
MDSKDRNYDIEPIFKITAIFLAFRKGKPRVTEGHKAMGPSPNVMAGLRRTARLPRKQSLPDICLIRVEPVSLLGNRLFFGCAQQRKRQTPPKGG